VGLLAALTRGECWRGARRLRRIGRIGRGRAGILAERWPIVLPTSCAMPVSLPELTKRQRYHILAAAFLAWMFAGLGIAQFILIHRQMMLDLLGRDTPETVVTQWFA